MDSGGAAASAASSGASSSSSAAPKRKASHDEDEERRKRIARSFSGARRRESQLSDAELLLENERRRAYAEVAFQVWGETKEIVRAAAALHASIGSQEAGKLKEKFGDAFPLAEAQADLEEQGLERGNHRPLRAHVFQSGVAVVAPLGAAPVGNDPDVEAEFEKIEAGLLHAHVRLPAP